MCIFSIIINLQSNSVKTNSRDQQKVFVVTVIRYIREEKLQQSLTDIVINLLRHYF